MKNILFAGFSTVDIINGKKYPGGAAASLAISAVSLGANASLLSILSDDENGSFYAELLKKNNVDISLCDYAPHIPTCQIDNVHGAGSHRIWKDNGVLPYFNNIRISNKQLKKFDAIFIANAPQSLITTIGKIANQRNIFYIPGPQLITHGIRIDENILKNAQLIFGNDEEAPYIFQARPFDYGLSYIIITKGKDGGTVFSSHGEEIDFDPPRVQAVDTTGAGDHFALGFSLEYQKGKPVRECIDAGIHLAGKVIMSYGAIHQAK